MFPLTHCVCCLHVFAQPQLSDLSSRSNPSGNGIERVEGRERKGKERVKEGRGGKRMEKEERERKGKNMKVKESGERKGNGKGVEGKGKERRKGKEKERRGEERA